MEEMKCPNCKGTKFETLGSGKYRCNYCGTEFTTSQPQNQQQTPGSVVNNYVNVEQKSSIAGCIKFVIIAICVLVLAFLIFSMFL